MSAKGRPEREFRSAQREGTPVNAPSHHEGAHQSPPLSPEDAQALAQRCADAMYARDRASQALGMRIVKSRARLRFADDDRA